MADTKAGPAITSANLPKPVVQVNNPTVAATVAKTATASIDENIVAAPLIEPDFVQNVRPKNPAIALRWILNRLDMRDGGSNYLRLEQAKSQGYAIATAADLVDGGPTAYSRDNGTKFINGDLILMKIDARKYKGAILYREQQAVKQMASVRQNAAAEVARKVSHSKTSVFHPTEGQLAEALKELGDDRNAAELTGDI
jgi:hypothetical protein